MTSRDEPIDVAVPVVIDDRFYESISEAARQCAVSKKTIYNWIDSGKAIRLVEKRDEPMPRDTNWNPNIAEHTRRAREHAGLSQSQAAELSGIDRDQIVNYESSSYDHRIYFPDHHVNMLASIYGVSAGYLRGGDPVSLPELRADGMTEDEFIDWIKEKQAQEARDDA